MSLKYSLQYIKMVKIVDERRHTDADISRCSSKCKRMQMQTDVARANCVQCVGRRNYKTRPDVRRLFKDLWDVSRQAATSQGGVGHYAAHRSLVWGECLQ